MYDSPKNRIPAELFDKWILFTHMAKHWTPAAVRRHLVKIRTTGFPRQSYKPNRS